MPQRRPVMKRPYTRQTEHALSRCKLIEDFGKIVDVSVIEKLPYNEAQNFLNLIFEFVNTNEYPVLGSADDGTVSRVA
jgi:hypothetical protein